MSPIRQEAADRPRGVLYAVATLSLLAALIHLWVMPEHFEEWWGYGTFFRVAAAAQMLYIPLRLRWPNQAVLLVGIAGNSAIVLLYLFTRVVGVPLFGPEAGEVEGVGIIDVCATSSETAIVVALGVLVLWRLAGEGTTLIGLILSAILLVGAHLPHLLLLLALLYRALIEALAIGPLTQHLEEGTKRHPEFGKTCSCRYYRTPQE